MEGIHIYVAHVDEKHKDVFGRARMGHSRVNAPAMGIVLSYVLGQR